MSVVSDTVAWVSELFTRIVNGIKEMGAVALMLTGFGCQPEPVDAAVPVNEPPRETKVVPIDAAIVEEGPRKLGTFNMTFYYVIGEDEVRPVAKKKPAAANDNQVASLAHEGEPVGDAPAPEPDPVEAELAAMAMAPNDLVPLYSSTCEAIADVSSEFSQQLRVQGTGRLRDGRVLTVWGDCSCPRTPCYQVTKQEWGRSGTGRALQPFRTVAVDPRVVKLGSLLFVPQLEGRTMPGRAPWGGFVHDGCVVADDTGGGVKNEQLDLFVGKKGWFFGLAEHGGSHAWTHGLEVFDGATLCERKGRKVARKSGAI